MRFDRVLARLPLGLAVVAISAAIGDRCHGTPVEVTEGLGHSSVGFDLSRRLHRVPLHEGRGETGETIRHPEGQIQLNRLPSLQNARRSD
jgi:hypothetical protein